MVFRVIVTALSLMVAALVFYLAAKIPQTATLPNDDVDKLAAAHANEELRLYQPQIDVGEPALSFEGAANVGAEVWVQHAVLDGTSKVFAVLAPAGLSAMVYATADEKHPNKNCRTSLTISRPDEKNAPQLLRLWQHSAGLHSQHFRQLTVSSPDASLRVEVSTNPPSPELGSCPRLLTAGNTAIPVPAGPVTLLVPANEPITLLFSAIDPSQTLFEKKDEFDGLSLGDGDLLVKGLDVVSISPHHIPLLHVVAYKGTNGFTLHDLKLQAEEAAVSVGEDKEAAEAWANGKRFPVFNLIEWIQKNPLLSSLLGAILSSGLWKWIKKICFPAAEAVGAEHSAA